MRTFDKLTEQEQAWAVEHEREALLTAILEGLRFDDAKNGDNLQARIDAATKRADDMQTPWFAPSYIMDTCAEDVDSVARASAEDALYADPDDPPVVRLPVINYTREEVRQHGEQS